MKEAFGALAFLCAVVVVVLSAVMGFVWANERWNCNEYKFAETQMVAATCLVKNEQGKWVTLNSYVKQTNVDVKGVK